MTEAKFTPGPWLSDDGVNDLRADREIWILSPRNQIVCEIQLDADTEPDEQDLADAHLIAAAPDLYEALEQCTTAIDEIGLNGTYFDLNPARAALAKARGEKTA